MASVRAAHGLSWRACWSEFYCNYTIAAANVPLLLVLAWNLFREKKTSALPLLIRLAILFLVSAPWLLYSEFWRQGLG